MMLLESYRPIAALTYLEKQGLLSVKQGDAWAVELTFDGGTQKQS
jgi:hypothetical protein